MLQHSGIAVVIFRRYYDQAVGAFADCRKFSVLDLLAGIVKRKFQIANINKFSLNAFAFLDFTEDEFRNVLTGAPFAHRAEYYRDEKRRVVHVCSYGVEAPFRPIRDENFYSGSRSN